MTPLGPIVATPVPAWTTHVTYAISSCHVIMFQSSFYCVEVANKPCMPPGPC